MLDVRLRPAQTTERTVPGRPNTHGSAANRPISRTAVTTIMFDTQETQCLSDRKHRRPTAPRWALVLLMPDASPRVPGHRVDQTAGCVADSEGRQFVLPVGHADHSAPPQVL